MKNFETRQEYLKNIGGFICHCELCHQEKIDGDDEKTYETFQKLEDEVEKIKTKMEGESLENVSKMYENRVKLISVPIIYFFDGRSPSRHKQSFFI